MTAWPSLRRPFRVPLRTTWWYRFLEPGHLHDHNRRVFADQGDIWTARNLLAAWPTQSSVRFVNSACVIQANRHTHLPSFAINARATYLSQSPRIAATLSQLGTDGAFGDEAEQLEEFYTDVLASLPTNLEWQQIQNSKPLVVGVTYGEDPRDFLRTATRCNPFNIVRELWAEIWRAEEHESRITAPR